MSLAVLQVHHETHGLDAVEQWARRVPDVARHITTAHRVRGAVVLSTCNRVELYVDCSNRELPALRRCAMRWNSGCDDVADDALVTPSVITDEHAVLTHLFRVAAGLDSMVVGEREVAGQLRRALTAAVDAGGVGYRLTEAIERALTTSRKVSQIPGLATAGRSVVAVALDVAAITSGPALLVGTGAYAGASLAALRERGVDDVAVHSASGRAEAFADRHQTQAVPGDCLLDAAARSSVVVACRGTGQPTLSADDVAAIMRRRDGQPLTIVDLSLASDVEAAAADVAGVSLVTLATVREHAPELAAGQLATAETMVATGVAKLEDVLAGRVMDPAVVALQELITSMVDDEVARLPHRVMEREETAHALRRLAARLIHQPRVRARQAALDGRAEEYLAGLAAVHGINPPSDEQRLDPDQLDAGTCPVTGMSLKDLGEGRAADTA